MTLCLGWTQPTLPGCFTSFKAERQEKAKKTLLVLNRRHVEDKQSGTRKRAAVCNKRVDLSPERIFILARQQSKDKLYNKFFVSLDLHKKNVIYINIYQSIYVLYLRFVSCAFYFNNWQHIYMYNNRIKAWQCCHVKYQLNLAWSQTADLSHSSDST